MKQPSLSLLTLLLASCISGARSPVEKPNILFILADDLGYSDVGFMGSDYYETPNLDALSRKSIIFTDGYAGCQVCSPSRATLITGQFTARHGITDWIGAKTGEAWREKKRNSQMLPAEYEWYISKDTLTLPQALKQGGYTTFFAGKWHLGDVGHYPENHGFDINKGGWDRGSPAGGFFAPFMNPKLEDHEKGENLTMRLAKETVNFIKSNKSTPFLAYLSFYAVHAPIETSKEKWAKYRDKAEKMGIADHGFENGDLLPFRLHQDNPIYAGLIESMDDAIGHVLNALKETGLEENTIVIFTSDNGGVTSGDHFSTSCQPLKGGKGHQWEGGIRVPYTVSVPWMNHQGQKNNTPVAGSDFFPTLLDLAGLPLQPEAHVDGKSIVPLLKGESLEERPLYWHYPHYGNQGGRPVSIMRQGKWKIIYYLEKEQAELYDLGSDLHEDHDLSKKHPELTQALTQQLLDWLKETGAKFPEPDPLYDEATERATISRMQANSMKRMESWRKEMLSKDYQPNKDWWGSITTVD